MGYETRHKLEVIEGEKSLIEDLRDYSEDAEYALESGGGTYDGCKWYDHEEDLRNFSKHNPKALLKLSGEGQESGDIWVEYYRNGKMQRCFAKITFNDFDESKLT